MRETLQESKRSRRYQENAASRSTAARRRRNARRRRRNAVACFLLLLACILLVGGAYGMWSVADHLAKTRADPVGDTDDLPAQPEDPSVPAVTPPSAEPASSVQTSPAPAEGQEPGTPAEGQEPEIPAEGRDPEAPEQPPEAPVQNTGDPDQNTGDPEQPSEDPDPTAAELPAVEEDAPPLYCTQEELDEQVQKALSGIITDDMTKLEQAKAVWDFTKNGIRYTGDSNKSDWKSGAYEGLTTRKGDCFTYYAVSRALLTALEIDNLEVRRVGGISSHYWNLVNCGDGWYHFDATPRSSQLPAFVSFMFTDQEAADYTVAVGGGREYYAFDGSLYPERGTGNPAAAMRG